MPKQGWSWLNRIFGAVGVAAAVASAWFTYQALQVQTDGAEQERSRQIIADNLSIQERINAIDRNCGDIHEDCLAQFSILKNLITSQPTTHRTLLDYLDTRIAERQASIDEARESQRLESLRLEQDRLRREREAAERAQRAADAAALREQEAEARRKADIAAREAAAQARELQRLQAEARDWNRRFDNTGRQIFLMP